MIKLELDKRSATPLYVQIFEQISSKIISGSIRDGLRLPSQRELSEQLGVSVNTVVNAYNMLLQYEYIISVSRSGYYVNGVKSERLFSEGYWQSDTPYIYNFSRNGVDLSMNESFRRELKLSAREMADRGFRYPDYIGDYELRKQLCLMLGKYYEIDCLPTQIIIGSGINYLLDSLVKVIGVDRVYGIENPSYYKLSDFMRISGYKRSYLNVGIQGVTDKELKGFNADVFVTMPYHHYPIGSVLTAEQKRTLLDWAGSERYIVEWGYDMELSYSVCGRSMFSMTDNKNVIFINDFTRTVAPDINMAYIILPESLVRRWQERYISFHSYCSEFEQIFITETLRSGSFYKNIRRLRKVYGGKRKCLISAVKSHPLGERIKIINDGAGTFLLIQPKTNCDADVLLNECHRVGVKISCVKNSLRQHNPLISPRTYILGFGGLSESEIEEGVRLLLDTWEKLL